MRAGRGARRTEGLGVLPSLEALELLREVGLQLGDLDERVRRLEALQLADNARHFLQVAISLVSAGIERRRSESEKNARGSDQS